MPCSDGIPSDEEETRMRLDHVTDLLCTACKRMEDTGVPFTDNLWTWWKDHKERDKEREKYERWGLLKK